MVAGNWPVVRAWWLSVLVLHMCPPFGYQIQATPVTSRESKGQQSLSYSQMQELTSQDYHVEILEHMSQHVRMMDLVH